jgi:hypothetical protein
MKSDIKDSVNQWKVKKRRPVSLKELLVKGSVMSLAQVKASKANRMNFEAWEER